MNNYLPADDRAETTLTYILEPFTTSLSTAKNINDIAKILMECFPSGLAYGAELRLRMKRTVTEITERKELIIKIIRKLLLASICLGLPHVQNNKDTRQFYYMREDIIRWYQNNHNYFPQPPEEIITVEVSNGDITKTSNLNLTEDQMIGISYGLHSLKDHNIKLTSSITNNLVSISNIVQHALIYRQPITLATEEIKRPYQVDILQPDGTFLKVYFVTPEFMQGVISVAYWKELPDNGKNIIWKNLCQFTKEGLIPLNL